MTDAADFHAQYAAALRAYLTEQGEEALAVGHELGRRALQEQVSMLEIVENHSRLVDGPESGFDTAVALQFLLQTLAALDVVTRGFLDGTKRYEQQRARADDLADRDEFHTALVNSLQEGFFVADRTGAVVEINDAFADITGYGADGLPYPWPHPWMADDPASNERPGRLLAEGTLEAEAPIRHHDGRSMWVAMTVNAVKSPSTDEDTYVGTIRDITAARAAAERERAVARLATAVSVAKSVGEVLSTRPYTWRAHRLRRSGMTSTRCCAGRSRKPAPGCRCPSNPSDGHPNPTSHAASWPPCHGTSPCGSSSVNPGGSAWRTGSSSPPLSDTSASPYSMSASSSSPATRR
jgi:PAS domain S-box-containing protein